LGSVADLARGAQRWWGEANAADGSEAGFWILSLNSTTTGWTGSGKR
jgi:hypothetical protein